MEVQPFEGPCGHLALFRGHSPIQLCDGPCGHLALYGGHVATGHLRRHVPLERPWCNKGTLRRHVAIWSSSGLIRAICPFDGPCAHLDLLESCLAICPLQGPCGHLAL
jgi:hypothetical protein